VWQRSSVQTFTRKGSNRCKATHHPSVRALINDAPVGAFMGDAQFFSLIARAWVAEPVGDAVVTVAAR
jgi:hypothetical protein